MIVWVRFGMVVLGQVVEALPDDGADVVIRQEIINGFALPARGHQLVIPQNLELMRNGGLGHAQQLGDGADAQLAFKERIQDAHPGGIAEYLEKVGEVTDQLLGGQLLPHRLQDGGVVMLRHHFNLHSYVLLFI